MECKKKSEFLEQELKKLLDDERLARLRLEYEIRDRDDDLADDRGDSHHRQGPPNGHPFKNLDFIFLYGCN